MLALAWAWALALATWKWLESIKLTIVSYGYVYCQTPKNRDLPFFFFVLLTSKFFEHRSLLRFLPHTPKYYSLDGSPRLLPLLMVITTVKQIVCLLMTIGVRLQPTEAIDKQMKNAGTFDGKSGCKIFILQLYKYGEESLV